MNTWYKNLNKSQLTPPSWVFGVVWPILYILMTIVFSFITYYQFNTISKLGSYFLLPYMIWISFAFYLNLYIVMNN